jgi:hypothetical protein
MSFECHANQVDWLIRCEVDPRSFGHPDRLSAVENRMVRHYDARPDSLSHREDDFVVSELANGLSLALGAEVVQLLESNGSIFAHSEERSFWKFAEAT